MNMTVDGVTSIQLSEKTKDQLRSLLKGIQDKSKYIHAFLPIDKRPDAMWIDWAAVEIRELIVPTE